MKARFHLMSIFGFPHGFLVFSVITYLVGEEVLLKGLIHFGPDFISRLNGIFAFCLLDLTKSSPQILLARDRFGVKPLFFSTHDNQMAFSSEIKPLLKVNWIKRNINPETLFSFLKFGHIPTPDCIFDSIKQLRPGSYMFFDGENYGFKLKYYSFFICFC